MATYIILSRVSPEGLAEPRKFRDLATIVSAKIRSECPKVKWKDSYATLGRFDIIDVVESDDPKQVQRTAMIIRAYGHCTTETLAATPWKEFLANI